MDNTADKWRYERGEGRRKHLFAEHCLPDIIGTNLQYALDAYVWETHLPMTEDGVIVSGFWENKAGAVLPEGTEMDAESRLIMRVCSC